VLRLIKTSPSLAVLVAVAVLAVAGGAVAWLLRDDAQPTGLSAIERVRASALLSRHAVVRDGHGDVDGDGVADCWIQQRADEERYTSPKLWVWRGCAGEPVTFEWWDRRATVLVIPPALASPVWLRWIARQITDDVSCIGIVGCPAPGQDWQWVLDSAQRFAAQPGHHGTVAPRWSIGPRSAGGALVLPQVPAGWLQRLRGSEEPEPATSLAGARIVVDLGGGPVLPAIACGGLTVHAEAGGIVGTTPSGRWTWLFRGLVDYGGFHAKRLLCRDGLVIATTGGGFADVVAIDPKTGGWLYDRSSDCCPGAEVVRAHLGDLWRRDYGTVVSLPKLHAWLALPAQQRPSLIEISRTSRPELAHDGAFAAGLIGRNDGSSELWGEPFAPRTVDAATRATLRDLWSCAGHRISWSPTAVLAERTGAARWLAMEGNGSTRRIASVACVRRKIVIAYVTGNDLLEESEPKFQIGTLSVDLDRKRWSVDAKE
jgi:hypothetical protein